MMRRFATFLSLAIRACRGRAIRVRRVLAAAAALAAAVLLLQVPVAHPAAQAALSPVMRPAAASADQIPSGDEVVTGIGDTEGYHLFAATAAADWRFRPLATLQPAGYSDEKWIGRQCLTGDGKTVVAVIAPWGASNSEAGMDRGGLAYAIDAHSGAVRPIAAGISLAYFTPACGIGSMVALTSYLGPQQRPTRITVVNANRARVTRTVNVPGEITSAVVAGTQILAARGADLVDVSAGQVRTLGSFGGQVASVHPARGGVDLTASRGSHATAWHLSASGARSARGRGPASSLTWFAGRGGVNRLVGTSGSHLTAVQTVSLDGGLAVVGHRGPARVGAADIDAVRLSGPSVGLPHPVLLPRPLAQRAEQMPAADVARPATSHASRADPTTRPEANGLPQPPSSDAPACSVARNDIFKQVWQPTSDQVRWAVNQAVQGALTTLRPTSPGVYATNDNPYTEISQAAPSTDFPLVSGVPQVPPLVMYGILAQESNFSQASWHAAPGRSGNPLIADYYGDPSAQTINYDNSDCGYGIAQVTDGMALGPTQLPTDQQLRIAVDYATNIAAAVQILQQKWQQLVSLGIMPANADGTKVENWYEAIWGYNTGVYSSPSAQDGLGWLNNPANPIYPARHTFLHDGTTQTYSDASTPGDWPYQERVFGWMEVPQVDSNGYLEYRGTFDWNSGVSGTGTFLQTPPATAFCSAANDCNPGEVGLGQAFDPCPAENSTCWFDQPVAPCSGSCVTDTPSNAPNNHEYYPNPGAPEPAAAPLSAACNVAATSPGPGALVVDDETLADGNNPGHRTPNLMGCGSVAGLIPAGASFSVQGTGTSDALTDPSALPAIDLHQLGGGLGGHMFFTHTRPQSDAAHEAVGVWSATLPADATYGTAYQVKVFVPDIGAGTDHAVYEIHTSNPEGRRNPLYGFGGAPVLARTINQSAYANQWVSLGYYLCAGSPSAPLSCQMTVTARSITPSGDDTQGADMAFDAMAFAPVPTGGYVALGDSYASGEGVAGSDGNLGGYDDGTDVASNSPLESGNNGDLCHRSAYSWPRLLAAAKNLPIIDLACSGSNIGDLTGDWYYLNQTSKPAQILGVNTGLYQVTYQTDKTLDQQGLPGALVPGSTQPPTTGSDHWIADIPNNENGGSAFYGEPTYQLDLLRALRPRLVTLMVGGNDVGFADILNTCLSYSYPIAGNEGCMANFAKHGSTDGIDNRVQSLEPLLASAYAEVAAAAGGGNRVTVVTYPSPLGYHSSEAPTDIDCTGLLAADRQWLIPKVGELASVILRAAAAAGIHAIDIHNLFNGHDACNSPYVTAPDLSLPSVLNLTNSQQDNWFHPNRAGYAAMESAIAQQIVIPSS